LAENASETKENNAALNSEIDQISSYPEDDLTLASPPIDPKEDFAPPPEDNSSSGPPPTPVVHASEARLQPMERCSRSLLPDPRGRSPAYANWPQQPSL
jgi:hypothetical protein